MKGFLQPPEDFRCFKSKVSKDVQTLVNMQAMTSRALLYEPQLPEIVLAVRMEERKH